MPLYTLGSHSYYFNGIKQQLCQNIGHKTGSVFYPVKLITVAFYKCSTHKKIALIQLNQIII